MAAVHDKMDAALLTLNVNSNEMFSDLSSQSKSDAEKTSPTAKSTSSDMQLDKFKRRLVRAVARYRQQKKPEDDMWRELKKEIGCDCKMLWQHMRALTLKKLKRLLPANDMLANITKVAQFTATDWLLFDLILVHENVDVISVNDQHEKANYTQEDKPECITELFELVMKHNVEGLVGDELTEAWIRVTLDYNSRGRQCSPMLLQLRWYQLKEMSRAVFYNFWYSYRGTKKYLQQALAIKPTELQNRIVKKYHCIITNYFPKWEQLIEERRIILSEEFAITRKGIRMEKSREEKEIELIEPQVETIDLASDESDKNDDISSPSKASDHGDHKSTELTAKYGSNEDNKTNLSTNTVPIKPELQDDEIFDLDGLSDVEATHIPLEHASLNISENLCKSSTTEIINLENEIDDENVLLPTITSVTSNATESDKADSEDELNEILEQKAKDLKIKVASVNPYTEIENTEVTDVIECDLEDEMNRILCEKANNLMNIEITQVKSEYDNMEDIGDESTFKNVISRINSEPIQCDSDEEINNLINEKAEKFMSNDVVQTEKTSGIFPYISNISENSVNIVSDEPSMTFKIKFEIDIENDNEIIRDETDKEKNNDTFDEMNFKDDCIEFVDDGIEFVDDQSNEKNKDSKLEIESLNDTCEDEKNTEENDVPKIDLKLLMDPKVFTKKLDLMEVFKFTDYHNVNDKRVIECASLESKPVDCLSVTEEDIKKFRKEALLGHKTEVVKNGSQEHDESEQSDDQFADNRVKSTSWLLQKPKNRSYNPIQLCKNPDFNTRLKRLTAGFLKMTRNRILLKECKPLTIDLHKAFETKLVNGTIYLKGCDFKSAKSRVPEINHKDLVPPSVIPGQSILNSETDKNKYLNQARSQNFETTENSSQSLPKVQCSTTVASERSKVIKLPDIDQVRRVNQGLLTAEVTPIRVDSNTTDVNIRKQANMSTPPATNPVLIAAKEKSEMDSVTQVKSEVPHIDKNSNKSNIMSEKVKHPTISPKINDKVIIPSHISASPVDTKKHQGVKCDKKIKKYTFSSRERYLNSEDAPLCGVYTPVCKENVTWSAKYVSNYYADSLLTIDTLNKILYLIEMDDTEKKISAESVQSQLEKNKNIIKQNITSLKDDKKKSDVESNHKRQSLNQRRRKRQLLSKPYSGAFCCWAREKLTYLNINRPVKGHGCLKFSCKCCCRIQLNKMQMKMYDSKKREASSSKVPLAEDTSDKTIILSDDEETRKPKVLTTCSHELEKESGQVNNFEVFNTSVSLSSLKTDDLINVSPMTDKISSKLGDVSNNAVDPSTSAPLSLLKIDNLTNMCPMTDKISSNLDDVSNNAVDQNKQVFFTNKLTKTSDNVTNVMPLLIATKSRLSVNQAQLTDNTTKNNFADVSNKKGRCKTTVIPAKGHPYGESLQTILPKLQSTTETKKITPKVKTKPSTTVPPPLTTISPSFVVSEKVNKSSVTFINNRLKNKQVKNPIFLGLNKILLCSLPNTTQVLPQLPALPEGVSFMLLPDGVLTLGISSFVEIHPHQICALPPMMAIIQEELRKNGAVFAGPNNEKPQLIPDDKAEEHSNMEIEHIPSSETNNLNDYCEITECIQNTQYENTQQNIGTQSIDKSCQNNEDVPNTQNNSKNENSGADSGQIVQGQETIDISVQVEIQTVEPQSTKENQTNSAVVTEDAEQCPKINREESRKTILSDLMEMSGISTEDTGMISNSSMVPNINDVLPEPKNALRAAHVLPPNIIPITRVTSTNEKVKTIAPDITIAGPYSNLLSFEPINSTNILLNYLGQIRPELNAVTSFLELKYVCDNNGEFYKLDVETGSIVGINVCLKKKSSILPSMPSSSKDVIDLTDDVGDDDISHDITQIDNDPGAQQDEQDISFEFYSQGKEPSVVKPLKLFKAVRLPQNFKGRSIIKPNVIKKDTSVSSNTDNSLLFMEIPTNLGANESSVQSTLDSSYDSSDDEPLAKKSKRIKTSNKNDEAIVPAPDLPDATEVGGEDGDMNVVEMNNMDIEGVNPELHPVVFEEDSESDDDMCILGV